MVRRQRVRPRRFPGRSEIEVEVERRLRVGEPGRGLAGGAREGSPAGRRAGGAAEAAVERLHRRQQQAERDQAVSDDPEDEPGGVPPDLVARPGIAAEQGAREADAPERGDLGSGSVLGFSLARSQKQNLAPSTAFRIQSNSLTLDISGRTRGHVAAKTREPVSRSGLSLFRYDPRRATDAASGNAPAVPWRAIPGSSDPCRSPWLVER
jgi:hypothetical protein